MFSRRITQDAKSRMASQFSKRSGFMSLTAGFTVGSLWYLSGSPVPAFLQSRQRQSFIPAALCAEKTQKEEETVVAGKQINSLPSYTTAEVAAHKTLKGDSPSVWVTYKEGVYDITQFVMAHPGGDKRIMLAAGGSIEAFWDMYTIHNEDAVRKILESLRIGNLSDYDPNAALKATKANDGAWSEEPQRSPVLSVLNPRPFNAETPAAMLDTFITPNAAHFVRNHMPVPNIDPNDGFCLMVRGDGLDEHCFTLSELQSMPKHTIANTIQCGGNRRAQMGGDGKPVKGLGWTGGGIGTAVWSGVRIRDLIDRCRRPDAPSLDDESLRRDAHVHFGAADKDAAGNYNVSVPYRMAVDADHDAIVAYEMNGEPVPRDHGYPLRAVVPGTVGVRNCKWLTEIRVGDEEAKSVWQQQDYKNFPPYATKPDPSLPSVMYMPVQSQITQAEVDLEAAEVTVGGYTYCGGGTAIQRVDLSVDGGKTFVAAADIAKPLPTEEPELQSRAWAWRLWNTTLPVDNVEAWKACKANPECTETFRVCSKATTESNHTQPERAAYNFRGLLNNSVSCVDAELN